MIQIHTLNDKQCRSRSVGFFRSQLIWSYTVCQGRAYPGSAGLGLRSWCWWGKYTLPYLNLKARSFLTWKEAMEKIWLRVNAGKTRIMSCNTGLDLLQSSGKFPCAVCHTGVGSNSIFCNGCKHWVHKKCTRSMCLTKDPDYRCTWCQGTAGPLEGRSQKEVQVGPDKLEEVACYLGDMLSAAGFCELSTTTHVKTAWKFKDLLPVLSSCNLSFKTRGHVYSSCVQSTMLHTSETWPLTKPNL